MFDIKCPGDDKNPQIFMETSFEKKTEVANVLGLTEWLNFITITDGGFTEYHRIEIYSGQIESKFGIGWMIDFMDSDHLLNYANAIYER